MADRSLLWDDLNALNRAAWEKNAAFWNERLEEGNPTHGLLLSPAIDRLLDIGPGLHLLDIACGTGQDARRLARAEVVVTAVDFVEASIAQAIEQARQERLDIDFRVVDATDSGALRDLGVSAFDRVLCNMALMDLPAIEPLAEAARDLLRPDGCLVFSVCHPCFDTACASQAVERWTDEDGTLQMRGSVKVWRYKTPSVSKGVAIQGQPAVQLYFDRPLELLLSTFFRAGFVMDALEEPAFPEEPERRPVPTWRSIPEIPPVLVARMRPRTEIFRRSHS